MVNWPDRLCEPAQKLEGGIRGMSPRHTLSIRSAKRVRPAVALLLLLLAFSLPPGCGTAKVYEGPNLPKAEIAVLKTPIFATFSTFPEGPPQIVNIDGRGVPASARTFELRPGRHQVSLAAGAGCSGQPAYVEFTAKGGHVYQLHTNVEGLLEGRVWAWIVDNNSGEIVGGMKPH